ncbi:MAG: hypothetical protein IJQ21_08265 [Lachnospiraceae bacterium]|nr:hypothetical protein [Lachnospiraceae bacterium]
MYCPKCGRKTPDENTTYCLGCGLNLGNLVFPTDEEADALRSEQTDRAPFTYEVPAADAPQSGYDSGSAYGSEPAYGSGTAYGTARETPAAEAPAKKKSKAPIIILAVILGLLVAGGIAALAIFLLLGGRRVHIPLNDYVGVTFEGYDGRGTAEATFDEERFMADYTGKIKLTGKGRRALSEGTETGFLSMFEEDADMAALFPLLFEEGYLTPSTDLSNGDTVTFQWSLPEESQQQLSEYMRCTVDASDKTFMVSELDEVQPADIFAGLTLAYTGVAPDGMAEVENRPSEEYTQDLQYEIDPPDGLRNGDSVTVTAVPPTGNLDDYLAEHYGVRAQESSMTFTVEGLNSIAESYEDISDEVKREMDRKAQELIDDYFQSNTDTLSYPTTEPAGALFLQAKDPENATDGQNMVILAYRETVRVTAVENGYEYVGDTEFCTWVSFSDIAMTEDGASEVDVETALFPNDTFFYEIPGTAAEGLPPLGSDLRGYRSFAEMEDAIRGMFENQYDITSHLDGTELNTAGGDATQQDTAPENTQENTQENTTGDDTELIIEDNPDEAPADGGNTGEAPADGTNPDEELLIEDEGGGQPDG